jgi:hypothetical protein
VSSTELTAGRDVARGALATIASPRVGRADTVSTLTGVLGDLGDCRCGRGEAEFVATNGQTTILDGIRSVELGGPYRNPFLSIWIKVSYIAGGTEPRVAFLCDGRWWGWRALLTCSGEDLANALAAIPLRSQRADHTSR